MDCGQEVNILLVHVSECNNITIRSGSCLSSQKFFRNKR